MCGITGIFAFNLIGKFNKIHITNATASLHKRGPDFQDTYIDEWVGLGHRRLSIIDTSAAGNQPMWDDSRRFCIIFNGEIFNYKELRKTLQQKGISFFSDCDTEVLLKLYIQERENCLNMLNGFFSFCIYDRDEQSLFIARDRYGIKPLLYLYDDDKFLFSSEMKAILHYGIQKTLDYTSLYTFLQLNYIPAPHTIFHNVKKLLPGHYLKVKRQKLEIQQYYKIPYDRTASETNAVSYQHAKERLRTLIESSVQRRLIADVPLGAFLSGGIDSSVITAMAVKHKPDLQTFSIGFKDEKFFDETAYANLVANHFKTKHTVFSLTNYDFYTHIFDILNSIDEPFADSSAIAVYILSKETSKHAKVALSGDGADELLGGYNKHIAFYRTIHRGIKEHIAVAVYPLAKHLPKSRNNAFSNLVRQLSRFSEGVKLTSKERYWAWASLASADNALRLLHPDIITNLWIDEYTPRKEKLLETVPNNETINDILYTDMNVVLPNDMLTKVDMMSMANSLEVRVPFLDYELVNYIFSLPSDFKINKTLRKRLLQDAFKEILPAKLYNRPKKGFEVPLLKWFRNEMRSLITQDLLGKEFIEDQGIFNYHEIDKLKTRLFSSNPADVHAQIWALTVFQWWWRKNI